MDELQELKLDAAEDAALDVIDAEAEAQRAAMQMAVCRGAKLLDDIGVRAWRDKIDPDKLDLVNTFSCVLGQAYEDKWRQSKELSSSPFRYGLHALALAGADDALPYDDEKVAEYGFDTEAGDYEALTTTWKQLLKGELECPS